MLKNINKVLDDIYLFITNVVYKKMYYLTLIFYVILAFGFNIFNRTVSIDDLSRDIYVGSGNAMIRGCRWGQLIWTKMFSTLSFTPFIDKFIALLFLIVSAILISCIFYKISNCDNVVPYLGLSCLYITFSLINEIWEYTGGPILIYGGISIVSLCILYFLNIKKIGIFDYLLTGLLLGFVISSYESCIFVYISLVAFILFYINVINQNNENNWLLESIIYAIPIIISILIKYTVGFSLIKICGLTYEINGDSSLYWFWRDYSECIKSIIFENIKLYFINSFFYRPIMLFAVFVVVYFVIVIRNSKKISDYILGILTYFSIFFLSFIRGSSLSYRFSQTVQIFIAFVGFLILSNFYQHNNKMLNKILITIVIMFICLRQGIYCHQILALNNQRSDNEAFIVKNIGNKIYSEFNKNKTVIFVGKYELGTNIEQQITASPNIVYNAILNIFDNVIDRNYLIIDKYIETNINSIINWNSVAFNSQKMMKIYLSYYGYDINVLDENDHYLLEEYEKIAKKDNMKPFSIKEYNDYIVVFLG